MTILAVVFGGMAGVLLRMSAERLRPGGPQTAQRRSLALTAAGAFLLGLVTGAALSTESAAGRGGGFGTALGSALFTYCVFGGAATLLDGGREDRPGSMAAAATAGAHALGGLLAAVPGIALAAWAVG